MQIERASLRARAFRAALLLAALVAGGCATRPTPYQPMLEGYGYSEQQLESNRYRVTFVGNEATSRSAVENYLTYRAAEITLQHGYDYFVVVEQSVQPGVPAGRGKPNIGIGFGIGSWGGSSGGSVGVSTSTGGGAAALGYLGQLQFLAYKGEVPQDRPQALDARAVKASLAPQVEGGAS